MTHYAPRISVSYADASGAMLQWAEKCTSMVVYEHEADLRVSQTHLHILMLGCEVQQEQFKRMFKTACSWEGRTGNALWSWTHKDNKNVSKKFVTYMSKGRLRPKFVKNFPMEDIEELRREWVEPTAQVPSGAIPAPPKYDEYAAIIKDGIEHFHDKPNFTLDQVRSWTISWYWKRDGRLPHIGNYKRNAGSLWLRLFEVHTATRTFSCGVEEIKSLWL